jgi:hypothetical protein
MHGVFQAKSLNRDFRFAQSSSASAFEKGRASEPRTGTLDFPRCSSAVRVKGGSGHGAHRGGDVLVLCGSAKLSGDDVA